MCFKKHRTSILGLEQVRDRLYWIQILSDKKYGDFPKDSVPQYRFKVDKARTR